LLSNGVQQTVKKSLLSRFSEFAKGAASRASVGFFSAGSDSKKRFLARKIGKGVPGLLQEPVDEDALTLIHALVSGGPAGLEILRGMAPRRPELMRDRLFEDPLKMFPILMALKKRLAGLPNSEFWASGVQGKTPLMIAVAREWKEGFDFLLPMSNLRARDAFRQGMLTQALHTRSAWAWLVDLCDVNETGDQGMTALMTAVQGRNNAGVTALLRNPKCDANAVTRDGYTALALAAAGGVLDLTKMLIPATSPEKRAAAFKETLRRLEASPEGEGQQWACLDALSAFVNEKDADRAYLIARGQARERMPLCSARREAAALRAEIGLGTGTATARGPAPSATAFNVLDEAQKSEETQRPGKSRRL